MEELSEDELRGQILNFPTDFKELIGQGNYYVKDHWKNIQTLKDLGITVSMRDDLILSLSLENYSSGPKQDELKPGCYWVFGKQCADVEIYIKLKIVTLNDGGEKAVCISFHPSEWKLKYPFG